MKIKSLRHLATLAALLGSMTPALASSLMSDAPKGTRNGWQSDASTGTPLLSQSYFVGTGGTVTSIVWWGYHGSNSSGASFDNFLVLLDGTKQSGALTESAESDFTRYELDINDIVLADHHTGELSITNNGLNVVWFWQLANTDNPELSYSLESKLSSAQVPEPGSLALAGLALLGLTSSARRRRTH